MIEFPQGAELIYNPVNRVPGFSVGDHHFVPGFPSMAWPMLEWVLDTRYSHLQAPGTIGEQVILVSDCRESQIIPLMEGFVQRYPGLRMSSLPHSDIGRYQLELGLRGDPELVAEAMLELRREVTALGLRWQPVALRKD
jgi:molybdopterin-biosynthesis enzyme MoeA-like protein